MWGKPICVVWLVDMIGLEVHDVALVEQKKVLEQALSTNPKTQKALEKLIRQVIIKARSETINNIHFQNGDPHETRRSVRIAVYKKILGGNINIYNGRKAHEASSYEPPRKLRPMQRGGNRMARGQRTVKMLSYGPLDRQMILRWVNDGTQQRQALGGRMSKRGFVEGVGANRGAIAPRNFFRAAGSPALLRAADRLSTLIDEELNNILNKNK